MLDRLLKSTYSALDRDPHGQIALRVRHELGFAWKVNGRVLTATTEAGTPLIEYGLRDKTLSELAAALEQAGCTVPYVNLDLQHRGADTLLDGSGRQSESNGDALVAYDSELWGLLDSFAVALEDFNVDIDAGLRQLYIGTAEDEFLEVWGGYFGLPRNDGESDPDYRVRIIVETLRPRVNAIAIEKAVFDMTGTRITLYEPWRDVFVLSQSALSGPQHMQDGDFYTSNVMQPQADAPIDWAPSLAIINRNRAAGTLIKPPAFRAGTRFLSFYGTGPMPEQRFSMDNVRGSFMASVDSNALGYLLLSDYDEVLNYRCNIFTLSSYSNPVGVNTIQRIGPPATTVKASISLSEDAELGSLNCTFGHSFPIEEGTPILLSGDEESDGYTLSDNASGPAWAMYEEVIDATHAGYAASWFEHVVIAARTDAIYAMAERNPAKGWSGGWDSRTWNVDKVWSNMASFTAA